MDDTGSYENLRGVRASHTDKFGWTMCKVNMSLDWPSVPK